MKKLNIYQLFKLINAIKEICEKKTYKFNLMYKIVYDTFGFSGIQEIQSGKFTIVEMLKYINIPSDKMDYFKTCIVDFLYNVRKQVITQTGDYHGEKTK
jgi:hypothetical protein